MQMWAYPIIYLYLSVVIGTYTNIGYSTLTAFTYAETYDWQFELLSDSPWLYEAFFEVD